MTDLSVHTPANPSLRPLARAWRAVQRFASARTADELGALADRYQNGQPALAARFRAAASATTARLA